MNLNMLVFKAINGVAKVSGVIDNIMIILSKYGPVIFMAVLAAFYLYGVYRKDQTLRIMAVDTFLITVITMLTGSIIGIFYYEARPFVSNRVNLLLPHAADTSFPSDHSLGTMSIALGVNHYNETMGTILIVLSVLVGISRVYVGAHYPLDVLGSYLIVLVVNYIYGHLLRDRIRNSYFKVENWLVKCICGLTEAK